jgi:uncharacterized LabA/DUF88 family protein
MLPGVHLSLEGCTAGVSFVREDHMPQRLVFFIDAQNMYHGAREAFFAKPDHHALGQFDPLKLGQLITGRRPFGSNDARALQQVRIYTGRPDSSKAPRTYAAHRRQLAKWEQQGIAVIARTLRYPYGWPSLPAEEKGIDVALAIDFVVMAVEGQYDIGVIASTDTDLRPALEYVTRRPGVTAEVAAWRGSAPRELSVSGRTIWSHRLLRADYDAVADLVDYNVRR